MSWGFQGVKELILRPGSSLSFCSLVLVGLQRTFAVCEVGLRMCKISSHVPSVSLQHAEVSPAFMEHTD